MNTTELKALAEKATQGDWAMPDRGRGLISKVGANGGWDGMIATADCGDYARSRAEGLANAAYIAAANPAAILSLIATLESAQDESRALLATEQNLRERVKALEFGLTEVETLMNESYGVAGLHLNGDVAPWSELRSGGRYEAWLLGFDAARALLEKTT